MVTATITANSFIFIRALSNSRFLTSKKNKSKHCISRSFFNILSCRLWRRVHPNLVLVPVKFERSAGWGCALPAGPVSCTSSSRNNNRERTKLVMRFSVNCRLLNNDMGQRHETKSIVTGTSRRIFWCIYSVVE